MRTFIWVTMTSARTLPMVSSEASSKAYTHNLPVSKITIMGVQTLPMVSSEASSKAYTHNLPVSKITIMGVQLGLYQWSVVRPALRLTLTTCQSVRSPLCAEPKIGSASVLTTKLSKNLTSVEMVSDRNCVQSVIQIKSDKNNFKCIQCADKEHFKYSLV